MPLDLEAMRAGKWTTREVHAMIEELAAARAEIARLRNAGRAVIAADDAFQAAWAICPYGQEGGYNKARSEAFLAASKQSSEAEAQLRAALEGKP